MKGLVGKKLGMTQLFDEESGGVTPVTVIEAGPCPVVAVRTPDADGYEAVQLAWEPVADRKVSKAERGHLAKAGVDGAYRHLVEFRGHFADAVQGESVTVEIFQPGDKVKVSGTGIGKGFQGTIKRHNFHRGPVTHGSHNVRKPGSIGASATPSRVFKGMKMAGRMGGKRATQVGLTVHSIDPSGTSCSSRAPCRARRTGSSRSGRTCADGRSEGTAARRRKKEVSLDEAVFAAEIKPHLVHEAVRAELNARRQGTRAAKSRGLVAAAARSRGARRAPGRARQGTIRAPQFAGGGVAFPPTSRDFSRQGEQEGRSGRACAPL
jgi:large subunit ribosomal protein L3